MKKNKSYENYLITGGFFLGCAAVLNLFLPSTAFADIQSSVTNAGNTVYNTIKIVSGAVGAGIMAIGWFGNMIPNIEINQRAKKILLSVAVSIIGLSFTMQIIQWLQSMS